MHLLVDSTGRRLCGPGEAWPTEKHRNRERRPWSRLHVCVDADTRRIVASTLTMNGVDNVAQAGSCLTRSPTQGEAAARLPMLSWSSRPAPVPCEASWPWRRQSGTTSTAGVIAELGRTGWQEALDHSSHPLAEAGTALILARHLVRLA
ncbi:transposase [Muricoccus vinaceus]|uniref:Transposase n=1 Tax=Muricoccus vinaceus TaxID=424704 RepID=A0ABV6ISN6_9PROT